MPAKSFSEILSIQGFSSSFILSETSGLFVLGINSGVDACTDESNHDY